MPYKGTADIRFEDFKIIYCSFDNEGSISFGGTLGHKGR
jgi:ribosomal protein L5